MLQNRYFLHFHLNFKKSRRICSFSICQNPLENFKFMHAGTRTRSQASTCKLAVAIRVASADRYSGKFVDLSDSRHFRYTFSLVIWYNSLSFRIFWTIGVNVGYKLVCKAKNSQGIPKSSNFYDIFSYFFKVWTWLQPSIYDYYMFISSIHYNCDIDSLNIQNSSVKASF